MYYNVLSLLPWLQKFQATRRLYSQHWLELVIKIVLIANHLPFLLHFIESSLTKYNIEFS